MPGFGFDSSEQVLAQVSGLTMLDKTTVSAGVLSNATQAPVDLTPALVDPVVARIYALDGTVRRASSLQMTADAKLPETVSEVAA